MLRKTVKYTDLNGEERQEQFYFNLNEVELSRLVAELGADIDVYTRKLAESQDASAMIAFIERLILGSYGEKSADGKRFVKSKEKTEAFEQSNAYAALFMQMLQDPKQSTAFGTGVISVANKQEKPKVLKSTTTEVTTEE